MAGRAAGGGGRQGLEGVLQGAAGGAGRRAHGRTGDGLRHEGEVRAGRLLRDEAAVVEDDDPPIEQFAHLHATARKGAVMGPGGMAMSRPPSRTVLSRPTTRR